MASTTLNLNDKKANELAQRIKFFMNTMDHDILIGSIERELGAFASFQCSYQPPSHYGVAIDKWHYSIRFLDQSPITTNTINGISPDSKLEALFNTLSYICTKES